MDRYGVILTIKTSVVADSCMEAKQKIESNLPDLSNLGTPWFWINADGSAEMQSDTETTIRIEKQPVIRFENVRIEGEQVGTFPVEVDPVTGKERGLLPGWTGWKSEESEDTKL